MSVFSQLMMRNKMKVEEMPLTVVGSPTIQDGVVSGFSSSDYLTAPQFADIETAKIELVLNYNDISVAGHRIFQFSTVSTNACQLRTISSGNITYYSPNKIFQSGKLINDYNYIRLRFENLEDNVEISVSVDGENWETPILTESENTQTFTNNIMVYGRGVNAEASINFNNSYIKINGTKYIFTIGA